MLYAEWSGTRVKVYNQYKQIVRTINVRYDVVGVQISGDSSTDAMVAIAQSNGKTDLYRSSGQLVRRG